MLNPQKKMTSTFGSYLDGKWTENGGWMIDYFVPCSHALELFRRIFFANANMLVVKYTLC
jgi:hypothetical protein